MSDERIDPARQAVDRLEERVVASREEWARAHGDALRDWVLIQARCFVVNQPAVTARLGRTKVRRLRQRVQELAEKARSESTDLAKDPDAASGRTVADLGEQVAQIRRDLSGSVQASLEQLLRTNGYEATADQGWQWYTRSGHRVGRTDDRVVLDAPERTAREQHLSALSELGRARDALAEVERSRDMAAAADLWGPA